MDEKRTKKQQPIIIMYNGHLVNFNTLPISIEAEHKRDLRDNL